MRYLAFAGVLLVAACGKSDGNMPDDDDNEFATQHGGVRKLTEAGQHLHEVGRNAKRAFRKSGAFPIGKAKTMPVLEPWPPGKGCCGGKSDGTTVDNKCAITHDWANDPVWKALDFHIDEPTEYRYTYESADGKSFTATAAGDLDCDGVEGIYTLTVSLDASGKPVTTIGKPAPNVY